MRVSATTRFIISTSGRPKSLRRYHRLLQELLGLDVAYMPISAGGSPGGKINPASFVAAIKGMNCIGGAISKDIKNSVIQHLDEVDELAQQVQSVNTIIRTNSPDGAAVLKGYNTDALGFRQAITEGIAASGLDIKTAVVYGYGGVSSVVFHVLQSLGIDVFVTGRRPAEAAKRAAQFGVKVFDPLHSPAMDLFVNATPVTDSDLALAANLLPALRGCKAAFDHEMPGKCLAEYCAAHGLAHIPGTSMYYPQVRVTHTAHRCKSLTHV
jgi:shikimate dehydrogenase